MSYPNSARSISLVIISLLVGPAFTHASEEAPAPQPDQQAVAEEAAPAVTPPVELVEAGTVKTLDDATPSILDRSAWPIIQVSPADGTVTHHPSFMGDPPMGEDIISPLRAPDPVWQIQEALAGADAGNLNGENLSALGAQPIIGLVQFIALPFRMILDNPLSEATSP